jgi:hypothetical protein
MIRRCSPPSSGADAAGLLFSQIAIMLALAGVAFGDPGHWIVWTVVASLVLGFVGATQDVTIDGWRITAAPSGKQSLMTAFSEAGYRVGTLAAGTGALIAADRYGWRVAYICMAADDDRCAIRHFRARARFRSHRASTTRLQLNQRNQLLAFRRNQIGHVAASTRVPARIAARAVAPSLRDPRI